MSEGEVAPVGEEEGRDDDVRAWEGRVWTMRAFAVFLALLPRNPFVTRLPFAEARCLCAGFSAFPLDTGAPFAAYSLSASSRKSSISAA